MRNVEFDKKKVIKYLVWTFALAYLIQAGVWLLYEHELSLVGQLVMAVMMFVPMLGVLLSGGKLSNMGWDPKIKQNVKTILIAWFLPAILTAAGAALYFLIFPGHFDLSGATVEASVGKEAFAQLEEKGITYPVFVLISVASSLVYAPLINTFVSVGEEVGWRGFLYPQLKARFGPKTGRLLGGVIWGAWHWPLIWLIGYEYGTEYWGFPLTGMLLFCVNTAALGVLCDRLYERSGSIWLPSLCHGAINAAAGLPLMLCLADTASARLLGPAPNGLIAGLPYLAVGLFLLLKKADE